MTGTHGDLAEAGGAEASSRLVSGSHAALSGALGPAGCGGLAGCSLPGPGAAQRLHLTLCSVR